MSLSFQRRCRGWWAGLLVQTALLGAGWDEPSLGQPLIETFNTATIGRGVEVWSIAQNPRHGTLWVGTAAEVLSYDGIAWRTHPFPAGTSYIRWLQVADDDVLWFGGSDDLGYAVPRPDGSLAMHSLRDRVPVGELPLMDVYAAFPREGRVDFVAREKIARWDGDRFTFWHFPTDVRLFPVVFEGELWVHHLETGLFRLGPEGPVRMHVPEELPARGLMHLLRSPEGVVTVSSLGLRLIGAPEQPRHDEAASGFMQKNLVSAAASLPGGFLAVSTVHGGIGILDGAGRLCAVVDTRSGLPGNRINALLLDREHYLWTGLTSGLSRLPAHAAVTRVKFTPDFAPLNANALVHRGSDLWAAMDAGLFRIATSEHRPEAVPVLEESYHALLPLPDGLLLSRLNGIDLHDGSEPHQVAATPAQTVLGFVPARTPGVIHVLESYHLSRLHRVAAGWERHPVATLPSTPTSVIEDDDGTLWIGLRRGGLWRLLPGASAPTDVTPTDAPVARMAQTMLVGTGRRNVMFVGRDIFSAAPGEMPRRHAFVLPGPVVSVASSPDGRHLYAGFMREDSPPALAYGLARIELDETGKPRTLQDLHAPGLGAIGALSTLDVSTETGSDTIWVGGSEGVLRLRPAALSAWRPPPPPTLSVRAEGAVETDGYRFGRHHLTLQLGLADLALRRDLRFQTRFGREESAWSAPTTRATFEFSNLFEGTYTFAARAVNPAGQAGEPVFHTFRVLPPWYRTRLAYAGYLAAAGLAAAGLMLYRERRIRRRNRELETLVRLRTAELEKASAAKDEFLASMSHEIRNPMNGVVGLSAAIDTSGLDEEGRHRFDLLRHCAAHLSTLLEDILDFSRLQSGRVELLIRPFSPAELLEAVHAITASDSAAAGIPVVRAIAPGVPAQLNGDARRIRQILLNFVGNALKYAGRGEVSITIWARPAGPGRCNATFAVTDEGPGIPPGEQARIFEKFERGAAARDARLPGAGMGLAVCRVLAGQMGGRVWLESTPGSGSTFYLELPLTLPARSALAASAGPALDAVLKWALVVDDEEYNCLALAAHLRQLGFRVRTEQDPSRVRGLTDSQPFDVIFLDYDMPGLNGPSLARQLRAAHSPTGAQPLILATTAYTTEEKRAECLAAGMDGFLGKPITPERLRQALHESLRLRGPAGALYPPAAAPARLDELRVVARHRGHSLAVEAAHFAAGCEAELAALAEAVAVEHARDTMGAAHRLAGRFAFIHATGASQIATKIGQCAEAYEWQQARALLSELQGDWQALRPELTESAGPGAA